MNQDPRTQRRTRLRTLFDRPIGPRGSRLLFLLLLFTALQPPPSLEAQTETGEVLVHNRTSIPLTISDSSATELAHVGPGSSISLTLQAGRHTLGAHRDTGSLYLKGTVHVPPGGRVIWDLLPTEAVLGISNQSAKAVTIEMDGLPLTEIPPEESVRLEGISPGTHILSALSDGTLVARTIADIPPRGLYHWNLEEAGQQASKIPVLQVRNFAGHPIDIFVDNHYRISLDPGELTAMIGLAPGPLALEARSGKRVIDSREVTLTPGQIYQWDVAGPDGARALVEVVNHHPKAVKVCVDGALCLKLKGLESVEYNALVPGRHLFQAYLLSSGLLLDAIEAELAPGQSYQWIIEKDNLPQTSAAQEKTP